MKWRKALVLTLVLLGLAAYALAQASVPPAPEPFDWQKVIQPLTVVVLYGATFALRLVWNRLPRLVVWAIPMVLGAGTAWLTTMLSTYPIGWQHWLIGAASIALNELITTIKQWGLNGSGPAV